MTEQEAEALKVKLAQIWKPEIVEHWHHLGDIFRWDACLQKLSVVHIQRNNTFWIQIRKETTGILWIEDKQDTKLHCFQIQQEREERKVFEYTPLVRAFVSQYLPLFRRNCWLSGANIEASAHEKVEWLQGLTPEEIESCTLKI